MTTSVIKWALAVLVLGACFGLGWDRGVTSFPGERALKAGVLAMTAVLVAGLLTAFEAVANWGGFLRTTAYLLVPLEAGFASGVWYRRRKLGEKRPDGRLA